MWLTCCDNRKAGRKVRGVLKGGNPIRSPTLLMQSRSLIISLSGEYMEQLEWLVSSTLLNQNACIFKSTICFSLKFISYEHSKMVSSKFIITRLLLIAMAISDSVSQYKPPKCIPTDDPPCDKCPTKEQCRHCQNCEGSSCLDPKSDTCKSCKLDLTCQKYCIPDCHE